MTRRCRAGIRLVLLALVAVLAACGDDGQTSEWWLVDATPDGRVLELVTLGGGCSAFVGWSSEADDDRVRIEARWEHPQQDHCPSILRSDRLVLDLTEPLADRELVGCRHEDCLALPAEGDDHRTFPAPIGAGGPGAVVVGLADVWGVEPDGQIAWRQPLDDPVSTVDELDLDIDGIETAEPDAGVAGARLEFDGEGTWLEVDDADTGEPRHRVRVTDPEAPIGPPANSTRTGSCSVDSIRTGSGSWTWPTVTSGNCALPAAGSRGWWTAW